MGLDGIDLLMEVEESFDTPIPDGAAKGMRTPGDMFDHLSRSGFAATPVGPCLAQAVFNRLRRAVVAEFRVDRKKVTPRTVITQAVPRFVYGARRKSLVKRLDFRRPPPLLASMNWFRRNYGTFGDLAGEILARNYGVLAEQAGAWNPREAWNCLRRIISRQLGVKIERVTRDADFVKDLGLS